MSYYQLSNEDLSHVLLREDFFKNNDSILVSYNDRYIFQIGSSNIFEEVKEVSNEVEVQDENLDGEELNE